MDPVVKKHFVVPFLEKLASYGVVAENSQDAENLLKIATMLDELGFLTAQEQPDASDLVKSAADELANLLSSEQISEETSSTSNAQTPDFTKIAEELK